MEQICQELGIAPTSDLPTILEHIRALKKNFKEQVKIATRLPIGEEIEGQGPNV